MKNLNFKYKKPTAVQHCAPTTAVDVSLVTLQRWRVLTLQRWRVLTLQRWRVLTLQRRRVLTLQRWRVLTLQRRRVLSRLTSSMATAAPVLSRSNSAPSAGLNVMSATHCWPGTPAGWSVSPWTTGSPGTPHPLLVKVGAFPRTPWFEG